MKSHNTNLLALVLVVIATALAFSSLLPTSGDIGNPSLDIRQERAMEHVRQIAQSPHAVGFPAHEQVREYLLANLRELGLEPLLQEGYTSGDWGNVSRAINILARIKGKGDGKALLLLSHYDSQPHSSFGASDAASGVATILEGVRAYLEQGMIPEHDIIVLFTDAEELGLNGADLFVNQHPWAKDVGLVLNFEARGSGGPSYFLIETNGGNAALVEAFREASPVHPVGNSLAYSIYKMLPNDTDLTVFREDRNIQGYNFAFIDDHFDYHTALDRVDRLDPESMAHQLDYLAALLPYFASHSLDLESDRDLVYFNVPLFGLVTYPYSWNWILWAIAFAGFLYFTVHVVRRPGARAAAVLKGFVPLLGSLLASGILGYFFFKVLLLIYPHYGTQLHGFTYNGHWYILAAVALTLAVTAGCYAAVRKTDLPSLLVGPALLWLLVCAGCNLYLPGASFFIIPVYGLLLGGILLIESKKPRPVVLALLGVPGLWIISPLLQMFPVGLGLNMMITATLLAVLLYYLLLPFLGQSPFQRKLASLSLLTALVALAAAHFKSGASPDRPAPSSLVYLLDADENRAYWATYEADPRPWTRTKVELGNTVDPATAAAIFSSKYGTGLQHFSRAQTVPIPAPGVETLRDTLVGNQRHLSLQVRPQRSVNRLEVFTNQVSITQARVNGTTLSDRFLKKRGARLFTHFISNNDPTLIELQFPAGQPLELTLYETANDLLEREELGVRPRPEDEIPTPFVLNDATVLKKTLRYE